MTVYLNSNNTSLKTTVGKVGEYEGQSVINTQLDFSSPQIYVFDPTIVQQANVFGTVKSLFVDNSTNPNVVEVTVDTSGQYFPIPPFSTGWYQITANENSKITLQSEGGATKKCFILLTNYDKEPVVYFGFAPLVDGAKVTVIGLDGITRVDADNPLIVGGNDSGTGRPLAVDALGRLLVVGSSGGGVAFGPDATGVAPTENAVQISGVDPGGLVRRILTTVAGLLRVSVDTSALPTGASTEATLATRASEATLATRASEATLATRATSALQTTINTTLGTLLTQATGAFIRTATESTATNTARATTSTVTTNVLAGVSVTILASLATRKSWSVYNDGAATVYLRLGTAAASATDFTTPLVPGAYYENDVYSGEVRAFGASGTLRVCSRV